MKPFGEQTIVITGGGSGFGEQLALRFAAYGSRIVLLDISEAALARVQGELGPRTTAHVCDVTDLQAVTDVLADVAADILINCAGIAGTTNRKSWELDPEDVHNVFQVNFFGSYYTSRLLLPGMVARGYGRVLHIASIAGKEGNAGMLAYSASKAAVIGMTKVQGKEVAGAGVTVNALAPAVIRTAIHDTMPEAQVSYMVEKIPMGRTGTLVELVDMVEFIVSPRNSFTTGFTFDLSGGRATY